MASITWNDERREETWNRGTLTEPVEEVVVRFTSTGEAPNGWKYQITDLVETWHVAVFVKDWQFPHRPEAYVTKDGGQQRAKYGTRASFSSLEAAKEGAEKHLALATAPKETDPTKLVAMLPKAQKDIILEAFDNGGHLEPDYGTRSERPLRQRRTQLLNRLEPAGIFSGYSLTAIGLEVAKLLKR